LKKEDVRIKTVLQDVYNVIENYNTRKDHSEVAFSLEIPLNFDEIKIQTDANKLKQILINLLKNAFKFTTNGYVKYGFKIIEERNKKFLLFFVEDSGIGISSDKQELIFDIFRQVEDSNTRRFGGAGIGLSVAKRLTELLGGSIWLKSEPEKGSTFFFTIPAESTEVLPQSLVAAVENRIKRNNQLVLIAEDDESSYMYLKTVLDKIGMKNIRAENGESAVDLCFQNKEIGLVLMDINMPLMNGYEATKIIKSKFPELPIIAQTAYAVAGDREKVFEAGCDEYISKPIKQDILLDKIEKIFALKNNII
jgi:CheY-like chemotaxis protein